MENIFLVTVEISKNSNLKYEINKETGQLQLDRVLFGSNIYPQNYGFIPNTLDYDKDPLDVVVISQHSLLPGSCVECRVLGAISMIDNGERDTKLLAVINVDPRYKHFQKLQDIPKEWIMEIEDFFSNYKNLENKKVELKGLLDWNETKKIIDEGTKMFKDSKANE